MMLYRSNYKWFIRIGLLTLGLSGILFALGDAFIPQQGAIFNALENPEKFAEIVSGKGFKFWAVRGLIGIPLETIGTIALFLGLVGSKNEKLAFWGMFLCILGDLFGTSLFAIMTYIFPEVAHLVNAGLEEVLSIATLEGFIPVFFGSMLLTYLGLLFFAIAIWNSSIFPKCSGVLVLIGFLLIAVDQYAVQIATNLLWGGAYFWMAIYSWNKIEYNI